MSSGLWRLRPYERHSLVLLIAGLSFVAMGVSMFFYLPNGPRIEALQVAIYWAPIEFWGTIFILVGLAVVVSARWPYHAAAWGYSVLTGLSLAWSGVYLAGLVLGDSAPGNFTYVLYWGLLAFLWWAISGLLNPVREEALYESDENSEV